MTIRLFGWTVRVERVTAMRTDGPGGKSPVEDKSPGLVEKRDAAQSVVDRATRHSGLTMGVYL